MFNLLDPQTPIKFYVYFPSSLSHSLSHTHFLFLTLSLSFLPVPQLSLSVTLPNRSSFSLSTFEKNLVEKRCQQLELSGQKNRQGVRRN